MTPTFEQINKAAAEQFELKPELLFERCRKKRRVRARWVAFALLREFKDWSLPEIGDEYGFDHSSVVYGLNKVSEADVTDARARLLREKD